MKSRFFILMILFSLLLTSCSERILSSIKREDSSELIYLFESRVQDGRPVLQIDVLFRGDASGETLVRLPSEWQGQAKLERSIRGLQSLTAGAQIRGTDRTDRKRIIHKPSEVLQLRYALVQDSSVALNQDENYLRPMVGESFSHWFGGAALVRPDWPTDRNLEVSLRWLSFSPKARIMNSFGSNEAVQTFGASLAELEQGVFLTGDFRTQEFKEGNASLWVALRGQWQFEDTEFFSFVQSTWKEDRRLIQTDVSPHRLVSLVSVGKQCCVFKGASSRHALSVFVATDQGLNLDFKRLISGELLRSFLSDEVAGGLRNSRWLWLRTGFAQFSARLLGLRAGWKLEDYLEDFNAVLREYWFSARRNEPYSELVEQSGSDRAAGRQLYLRGDLFGHAALASALKNGKTLDQLELEVPSFLRAMKAKPDETPLPLGAAGTVFEKNLLQGKSFSPESGWLGNCARLEWHSLRAFELGFNLDASKQDGQVAGVKHESAAYRAGLRRGQKLMSWRFRLGDPLFEAEIRIREARTEKTIRYLPATLQAQRAPQYVLDASAVKQSPISCFGSSRAR